MRLAIAALLALLALAPSAGGAQPAQPAPAAPRKTKVLILDFTVKGDAAKDLGRVLADVAARELAKLKNVQALTQADVTAQLGVEKQKTMLGCAEDRSCMAEIAGAIDADRTLGGSVVQLGDAWLVSLTYVDARRAATIGGDQETLRGGRTEQLVDAVRRLSFYAATGQRLETTGALDFDVAEPDAKVLLDGEQVGAGPYKATRRAIEGTHRVAVLKDGFATWETEVRVAAGGATSVKPTLAALPKQPVVQQVTVIQQVVAPAEDRFLPLSIEFRMMLSKPFEYQTEGVPACIDSFSKSLCLGPRASVRAGYRFNPTWAVEGGLDFFSYARSDQAVGYADTKGFGLLAAGVHHPAGNRWFGLAAEVGVSRTTVEIQISDSGPRVSSWRPFAGAEARLDFPLGEFLLGLRGGIQYIAPGEGASYTAPSGTLTVKDGAIVAVQFGAGIGGYF